MPKNYDDLTFTDSEWDAAIEEDIKYGCLDFLGNSSEILRYYVRRRKRMMAEEQWAADEAEGNRLRARSRIK
jgi:hypothetical protein